MAQYLHHNLFFLTIQLRHYKMFLRSPVTATYSETHLIEHGHNKLCLISKFSEIPTKITCISHYIYKTFPTVLWIIPNFPVPGDHVSTPSGAQFGSNGEQTGLQIA